MSQATMSGVMNGVDVERLGQTIQAIQKDPGVAKSQFRAVNRWVSGGHNQSVHDPGILCSRAGGYLTYEPVRARCG